MKLAQAAQRLRHAADSLVGQASHEILIDLLKTAARLEKHAENLPVECQEMRQILAELEAL